MSENYVVCAFYKFVQLNDYVLLRDPLYDLMDAQGVKGTVLLAGEGINGTIAGKRAGIDAVFNWLKTDPRLTELEIKESYTDSPPFIRTKVRLKKEIVTLGVDGIDPNTCVGTYVEPTEWNALISDPEVTVIDTRNDYEYEIGTFRNALNPKTESFRELPEFVEKNLDPEKHKRVAMFCTGGIRCEKSTALLKNMGFDEVYHLKGGILKYLEEVPKDKSLWDGECFVFDNRVSVNHDLEKGNYELCHGCRQPISDIEKQSELFVQGISCPKCYHVTTEEQRRRFAEREKQIRLAERRGTAHLGDNKSRP